MSQTPKTWEYAARAVLALVLVGFAFLFLTPIWARMRARVPLAYVHDGNYQPVPHAAVRFRHVTTGRTVTRTADAQGEFRWSGLRELREYPTSLKRPPAYEPVDFVVAQVRFNSKGPSRLVLSRRGTYTVRVVDARGLPMRGVRLYVAHIPYPRSEQFAATDAGGRIVLPGLPIALRDQSLVFGPEDYQKWTVADRKRTARGDTVQYRLTLVPSATITGRVLLPSGSPASGFPVRAFATAGPDGFPEGYGTTDATGRYRVHGLKPGTYRLHFERSGTREEAESTLVTVKTGETTKPPDILLTGATAGMQAFGEEKAAEQGERR